MNEQKPGTANVNNLTTRTAANMTNDLVKPNSIIGNEMFEYTNSLYTNNASVFNTSRHNHPTSPANADDH